MQRSPSALCWGALTQALGVLAKGLFLEHAAKGVSHCVALSRAQGLASTAMSAEKWLYALFTDIAVLSKML